MKSIAIFAPYVGTVNRGAETFVIELTLKLRENYKVDVYSIKKESKIKDNSIEVPIKENVLFKLHQNLYISKELYRKVINKFYFLIPDVIFQKKFTKKVFKKMGNKKYDLLYPNNGVWGAYYSKKYRDKTNTPFIYTGHGGIGYGEQKILENMPDVYVCLTEKHKEWAEDVKPQGVQIAKIPNGVNVSDFIGEKTTREKRTVLSVGALTDFKRHDLTINAIEKLPDVHLVIMGKGEEEERLRQIAEEKIPGRYEISSVSYDEIKRCYKNADVFVLPSLEEPFGIVYLEAMSSNVPVVVPDDVQRREIVGDAGLYCDVTNAEEYASYIKKAMERDWKDIPVNRAKLFEWSAVAKEYMKIVESLI